MRSLLLLVLALCAIGCGSVVTSKQLERCNAWCDKHAGPDGLYVWHAWPVPMMFIQCHCGDGSVCDLQVIL